MLLLYSFGLLSCLSRLLFAALFAISTFIITVIIIIIIIITIIILCTTCYSNIGNYLYWTDNAKNYTGRINRFTGSDFSEVLRRERFMGIRILEGNTSTCTWSVNGIRLLHYAGYSETFRTNHTAT